MSYWNIESESRHLSGPNIVPGNANRSTGADVAGMDTYVGKQPAIFAKVGDKLVPNASGHIVHTLPCM